MNEYTAPVQSEKLDLDLAADVERAVKLLTDLRKTNSGIPPYLLMNLQKTLQSDFCKSVQDVYEKIHNTVDISGTPEIKANATAKATVAAFAASEGHSHPRVVELPKTEEGFGFNIMGGKEQKCPIYISRIIPGGVADRHGGLRRGDQIISINAISIEGESHEKTVGLLKATHGLVKLVVKYDPSSLEQIESKFEQF